MPLYPNSQLHDSTFLYHPQKSMSNPGFRINIVKIPLSPILELNDLIFHSNLNNLNLHQVTATCNFIKKEKTNKLVKLRTVPSNDTVKETSNQA